MNCCCTLMTWTKGGGGGGGTLCEDNFRQGKVKYPQIWVLFFLDNELREVSAPLNFA